MITLVRSGAFGDNYVSKLAMEGAYNEKQRGSYRQESSTGAPTPHRVLLTRFDAALISRREELQLDGPLRLLE